MSECVFLILNRCLNVTLQFATHVLEFYQHIITWTVILKTGNLSVFFISFRQNITTGLFASSPHLQPLYVHVGELSQDYHDTNNYSYLSHIRIAKHWLRS